MSNSGLLALCLREVQIDASETIKVMKSPNWSAMLFAASFLLLPNLSAATLKILNPADGYNGLNLPSNGDVSTFASILGNDFDTIVSGSLGDPSYLSGADALIVNLVDIDNAGGSFSAVEIATLTGIFSGTTRALVFFENDYWTGTNNVLAGLLGGSYLGQITGLVSIIGSSALSTGITGSINTAAAGQISGGEQVVGSVLTLRGPESNVILLGDVNMFDNVRITGNNLLLAQNVSSFLAVPEPSAAMLLLVAGGLCFRRRR